MLHPLTFVGHNLKHRISSPFDFQHLTHTDRHQFASLQQTSENELVAEFWAVRASQAPRRNLTGIKAEDLHFDNFSSESITSPDPCAASAMGFRSLPVSPDPQYDQQQPMSPGEELTRPSLRSSRSVESFSRPGVNPRFHRHTQSANPPPRISSRSPLAPIHDIPEDVLAQQSEPHLVKVRSNRQSGVWDKYAPLSPASPPLVLPTMAEEVDYVGHALTTPDNSAIHTVTPPFTPGLDDVAEEPERFVSPRPAPSPPTRSPRMPSFESFSFGNQRSPIAKSQNRKSSFASPKSPGHRSSMTRPISQMSDTLGSPNLTRRGSIRRAPSTRRKSNTWRVIEESWEDDIDYIYDNALEADCDFEWDRTSDDGAFEDRDRTPEQQDHSRSAAAASHGTQTSFTSSEDAAFQTRIFPGAFPPSLLVPSPGSVPELESRSAISASTIDTGVQTPSDLFDPLASRSGPFTESEGFSLTPSLLVPQDFKDEVSREDMYDDLLADYQDSDRHFPLLEASQSIASSTRSSHVRSSKRSSYDSSLMSSGQGSGSWTSGIRRSASSSGSLPELVHSSRHARRDFNAMVENLTEQVASFASFGEDDAEEEEDDDTTPPGRATQERSFFASDDEQLPYDNVQVSIETEVRASLELARRGSTRSSRAPLYHHKYASSDGAAKMLASSAPAPSEASISTMSRNRAASSSNVARRNRDQYLSLFPSPPTHSPLASPISPLDNTSPHF